MQVEHILKKQISFHIELFVLPRILYNLHLPGFIRVPARG